MIPATQDRVKAELVRAAAVRLMKPAMDELLAATNDSDESVRVPIIYNLYTDPREEKQPAFDTWVVAPMLKIVGEFEESVKKYPLIPMGTPDPYVPPAERR